MNLLIIQPEDLVGGASCARVKGRRLRHVRGVHRAAVGDTLKVGLLGGRIGSGTIVRLDDDALELEITLERDPPAPLPLTLVLALPRPKVLRRVLQGVAAMGVKRVVLLGAWRVERSYWGSPLLAADELREQLLLGLEQGGDTLLPDVILRRRFKPFVEDELAELARDTRRLLAHPAGASPCPFALRERVTLIVGPEGGLIDYELDALRARGFELVSLGVRPLRVEHVVPALLGRLSPGG